MRFLERLRSRGAKTDVPTVLLGAESLAPTVSRLFVDRQDVLATVTERLSHGAGLTVLSGPMGVGKTWVLVAVGGTEDVKRPALYLDCTGVSSPFDFARTAQGSIRRYVACKESDAVVRELDVSLARADRHLLGLAPAPARAVERAPDVEPMIEQILLRILKSQETVQLVKDPGPFLTHALLKDLAAAPEPARPVVLIDRLPYEWLESPWVVQLISGLAGLVPVVLTPDGATSRAVAEPWTSTGLPAMVVPVKVLEPPYVRECVVEHLRDANVSASEEEVSKIAAFSRGLPLAIQWTVHFMGTDGLTDFTHIQRDALTTICDTVLSETSERFRRIVEVCAVTRWLDVELLRSLLPVVGQPNSTSEAHRIFQELAQSPFFTVAAGRLLLPSELREFLEAHLRDRDAPTWHSAQVTCLQEHERRCLSEPGDATSRSASYMEWGYHCLQLDESGALDVICGIILRQLERADFDGCRQLLTLTQSVRPLDRDFQSAKEYFEAEMAFRQGQSQIAMQKLNSATDPARSSAPTYANAAITLGRLLYRQGDLPAARGQLQAAVDSLQQGGPERQALQAYALEQLAKVQRMQGDLAGAITTHEKARNLSDSDAAYIHASSLGSWGTTLLLRGDLRAGVEKLGQAIRETQDFPEFTCTDLRSRAVGLALMGALGDARSAAKEALGLAEDMGDRYNRGFAGYVLAWVNGTTERPTTPAWDLAFEDLALAGATNDLANAHLALADCYLRWGMAGDSRPHIQKAGELLDQSTFAYGRCHQQTMLAWQLCKEGEFASAASVAQKACDDAEYIGARRLAVEARLRKAEAELMSADPVDVCASARTVASLALRPDNPREAYFDLAAWATVCELLAMYKVNESPTELQLVGQWALQYARQHNDVLVTLIEDALPDAP